MGTATGREHFAFPRRNVQTEAGRPFREDFAEALDRTGLACDHAVVQVEGCDVKAAWEFGVSDPPRS